VWHVASKKKRPSRRKYSTRLFNAIRKLRSALATLKRKKVIPKTVQVRKAVPTPGLRRIVSKHKAVVAGQATTYRLPTNIPPQVLKDLKSLGYKVTGKGEDRRLIVPKSQYVRKGKVYERPTRSRKGYRVERTAIDLSGVELQIRTAFEKLKGPDLIGFEIGDTAGHGGRSYHLYASPEAMIADVLAYAERGWKFSHLTTFKVTKAKQPEYQADASRRARERVMGSPEYRARRNQRARDRRASRKGVRASRGH
jgi:hypothetical protein